MSEMASNVLVPECSVWKRDVGLQGSGHGEVRGVFVTTQATVERVNMHVRGSRATVLSAMK
jgi:hypothetical protein